MQKDLFLTLDWNSPHVAMSEVFFKDPSNKFKVKNFIELKEYNIVSIYIEIFYKSVCILSNLCKIVSNIHIFFVI